MAKVKNAKQRILYVEGNVDGTIGGSFFSLLFLASGVDRNRFEPIVVFAAPNGLLPRFHSAGIRTEIVPLARSIKLPGGPAGRFLAKSLNFLRGALAEPARLAKLMKRERIDLLHLNNSIVRNHAWMIAARMAGIPCITHERGINDVFQPRARTLARYLRAVVCISGAVRDNFHARGLGGLPLVTIYNGLDPAEMKVTRTAADVRAEIGAPEGARLVGIVGNIKPWKGQEVVVRAMAELRSRYPDVICVLIGDTSPHELDYRDRVLSLARELGVQDQIRITGYRQDVANYVNVLEVQIHASIAPEPFGRVLLEAMALSKPMAASNGGAVPEILVHGSTGMLFEPGSHVDLARVLDHLLGDPARAAAMGVAGRARLDAEFSIARNIELTHQLYERVFSKQDVTKS
jgi:glycosyltransferase involved in cell wall biosynthesis